LVFVDSTIGFAVGTEGVIRTRDGGTTWEPVSTGLTVDFTGVSFADSYSGIIVGDRGVILRTTDGGESWSLQESGTSWLLSGASFPDPLHAVVVGEYGTILGTSSGGWVTSVASPLSGIHPDKLRLEQNFPNPFNPTTTIRFQIPVSTHVNLSLFDILGRKLVTLTDETMESGEHRISWDASRFSSGIYFYQLRASGSLVTGKMILLR